MAHRSRATYARRVSSPLGTAAVIASEAIHRLSVSGLPRLELFKQVAARVASVVPYDAAAWLITDPATLLQTGAFFEAPGDVPDEIHRRYADNELLTPDFAKIVDVAQLAHPVTTLRDATDGDLSRSARHRTIHAELGIEHELRAAFRTGQTTWGAVCLSRITGGPDFTPVEKDFLAAIGPHVGNGLRLALLIESTTSPRPQSVPGIIVIRGDDTVESLTPEAEEFLAQIGPDEGAHFHLPSVVQNAARQARAIAAGAGADPAPARIRLESGRWLLVRAAQLHRVDGPGERIAVLLEPARAAELAPIIVELYELSPRERQVTELLLRGLPIEDIATTLWISRHTVRDYTKAIFAKLSVGSRPELTAKLFHDHYLPDMDYATGKT